MRQNHLQFRHLPVFWHFGLASSDEKGGAACYCEVAFPARLRFSICGQVAFCASSPDSLPSYQSCKNYLLNTSQISSWLERIKQKASLIKQTSSINIYLFEVYIVDPKIWDDNYCQENAVTKCKYLFEGWGHSQINFMPLFGNLNECQICLSHGGQKMIGY